MRRFFTSVRFEVQTCDVTLGLRAAKIEQHPISKEVDDNTCSTQRSYYRIAMLTHDGTTGL